MIALPNKTTFQHIGAFGIDWGGEVVSIGSQPTYRRYQYNLMAKQAAKSVLEVGNVAPRSFTRLVVDTKLGLEHLLSIEPSRGLWEKHKTLSNQGLPDPVTFDSKDLSDLEGAEILARPPLGLGLNTDLKKQ